MHLHPKPNAPLFCEEIYCGSIIFHGVNVRGLSKFCCFVVDVISWIPGLLHYKQDVNSLLSEINSAVNTNTWNPRKLIAHEQWWFHIISRQLHLEDNSFKKSHLISCSLFRSLDTLVLVWKCNENVLSYPIMVFIFEMNKLISRKVLKSYDGLCYFVRYIC